MRGGGGCWSRKPGSLGSGPAWRPPTPQWDLVPSSPMSSFMSASAEARNIHEHLDEYLVGGGKAPLSPPVTEGVAGMIERKVLRTTSADASS